jgi:hypothetical protein
MVMAQASSIPAMVALSTLASLWRFQALWLHTAASTINMTLYLLFKLTHSKSHL